MELIQLGGLAIGSGVIAAAVPAVVAAMRLATYLEGRFERRRKLRLTG